VVLSFSCFVFNSGPKKCHYEKGKWGKCDPVKKQKTRTLSLKQGSSTCEKKRTHTRRCNPNGDEDGSKERSRQNKRKKKKKRKKKPSSKESGAHDGMLYYAT
jgi:hypothetical protein